MSKYDCRYCGKCPCICICSGCTELEAKLKALEKIAIEGHRLHNCDCFGNCYDCEYLKKIRKLMKGDKNV